MKILITGGRGFIASNLHVWLQYSSQHERLVWSHEDGEAALCDALDQADFVFHLAGVNRPREESEFAAVNTGLTTRICDRIAASGRGIPIVYSSSLQADLDNSYGRSKASAERVLEDYAATTGAPVALYRLPNVFGKWARPNYNSVIATFCHNIARGIAPVIHNADAPVRLVHVDDVVQAFITDLDRLSGAGMVTNPEVAPQYNTTVGELASVIHGFRVSRSTAEAPDVSTPLKFKLYGTYLSYLETTDFAYRLDRKSDARGALAEFLRGPVHGQFFVSGTLPGVTRGNHFHHAKTEKFLVLYGTAAIRFRDIRGGDVIEYRVKGEDYTVVDIPPGYTHSLENIGHDELITLFWASERFDPDCPDTIFEPVIADVPLAAAR